MGLHTRQMAPFLEFVLQISELHGWVRIVSLYHVSFIQEEDKETESHKEDHSEARALHPLKPQRTVYTCTHLTLPHILLFYKY